MFGNHDRLLPVIQTCGGVLSQVVPIWVLPAVWLLLGVMVGLASTVPSFMASACIYPIFCFMAKNMLGGSTFDGEIADASCTHPLLVVGEVGIHRLLGGVEYFDATDGKFTLEGSRAIFT